MLAPQKPNQRSKTLLGYNSEHVYGINFAIQGRSKLVLVSGWSKFNCLIIYFDFFEEIAFKKPDFVSVVLIHTLFHS